VIGLLRQLAGIGFRRGMGNGNRIWLALGVLSWFAARSKEKSKDPPALYCETLGINPETVLVIRNDTLVTHDERLEEPDTVEIRPVISGG
jgi:molybdopterin converting factor small subunit